MATSAIDADFIVWGIDRTAYGPVELPTLVAWVKDERVTAETWVFACKNGVWHKAAEVPELQMFFRPKPGGAVADTTAFACASPAPASTKHSGMSAVLAVSSFDDIGFRDSA